MVRRGPRGAGIVPLVMVLMGNAIGVVVALPNNLGDDRQRQGLERFGLIVGGAVALALAVSLIGSRGQLTLVAGRSRPMDRLMCGWAVLAGWVVAVGILAGNPLGYVVSDGYRYALLPVVYFVVADAVARSDVDHLEVVRWFAISAVVAQLRDVAIVLTSVGASAIRMKTVFWMQNVVGLIALGTVALHRGPRAVRLAAVVAGLAVAVVGLSRGFRSYLGVLAAVALAAVVVDAAGSPRRVRIARLLGMGLLAATVLSLVGPATANVWRITGATIERSVQFVRGGDESSAGRLVEAEAVIADMADRPVTFITGTGAGSMFALPEGASDYKVSLSDGGREHNVHNSALSALFRAGVAGLALLVATFARALRDTYRALRSDGDAVAWFAFLAVLAYALMAPMWFFVPGDILFPCAVGVAEGVRRRRPPPAGAHVPVAVRAFAYR